MPTRRRGRPPLLERDAIVRAAAALNPDRITLQAVATSLAVDASSLHYHVGSRTELLALVAQHKLQQASQTASSDHPANWESSLIAFGQSLRALLVEMGVLTQYLSPNPEHITNLLPSANDALEQLCDAGLPVSDAARTLALVTEICFASARNARVTEAVSSRPQRDTLQAVLDESSVPTGARMQEALEADIDMSGFAQFNFDLTIVVNGVARRIIDALQT